MKSRRAKLILTVVICVVALLGIAAGCWAVFHQPEAVIQDHTASIPTEPTEGFSDILPDAVTKEPQAIVSANLNSFTQEDGESVNQAIESVTSTDEGVLMVIETGTAFDALGPGDIFFLEGDEDSPFGDAYFGKVVSVVAQDGSNSYLLETPMIDEVFDSLCFTYTDVLTVDNVQSIQTLPGVTYSTVDSLASHFGSGNTVAPLKTTSGSESLMFEIEVDLLEVFGITSQEPTENEVVDITQAGGVTVYRTTTGNCYHQKTCPCVARSQYEMTLAEAVEEGFDPCYLCSPPLLSDKGVINFQPSLKLTGKLGLESIDFDFICDWDIVGGDGMRDFAITADSKFLAEVAVEGNVNLSLSGRTTKHSLFGTFWHFEGLKERMFPLAAIRFGSTIAFANSNEEIRAMTGSMPLSVIAIVYADIEGNISMGFEASLSSETTISYSKTLYRDGEYINEEHSTKNTDVDVGIDVEVSGDADTHVGAGLELYVFNLKIAQLDLIQIGAEAQGTLKLEYSTDTEFDDENWFEGSYYMRLYYKLCELDICFKSKANFLFFETGFQFDYDYILVDHTIAEWGSKNPTRYNSTSMDYGAVTAKDSTAQYYINPDGKLVREFSNGRTVIHSEPFFSICGIDDSYLYILVPNSSGSYDIVRVAKDGSTYRTIAEGVSNCLTMDEENMYIVFSFDKTVIYRLNRSTLNTDVYADSQRDVVFMAPQGSNFYVITRDNDLISVLWGAQCYYYVLDKDGQVLAEYGANPDVTNLYMSNMGSYWMSSKIVSSGYLRDTSEAIYWVSPDRSTYVQTECISGWNYFNVGIITTQNNDQEDGAPYKMILYRAADGSTMDITSVFHDSAFFTLCQGPQGEWYYFDQTDNGLILYSMSANFSSKTALKQFSAEELPCNLSNCAVSIMNNRIYFYTMPDSTHCTVLYIYEIV